MILNFFYFVLSILEISIFGYFFYVSVYNFILSFAGLFYTKRSPRESIWLRRICVLIPAYKEDAVISRTVIEALETEYPKNLFQLVIISDSMLPGTLKMLKSLPVKVIEVSFEESTKVKAIRLALNRIKDEFEVMVILDADNIMDKDFLKVTNSLFDKGYKVVQGCRCIRNPNNQMAILDDLSEQINNHINRKGSCSLGGSSSIAGSGFAVDYHLGKEMFDSLNSIGGFDKEFELFLLKRGHKTAYFEELIVYDEKVETKQVFRNQRRRWISSQYSFLRKYFLYGVWAIFQGKFAIFNSVVLRNAQLPRLLNVGLFSLVIFLIYMFDSVIHVPFLWWIVLYISFLVSILFSIPKKFYSLNLLRSLGRLPSVFFTMFLLMFRLRGANRQFIHTPHGSRQYDKDE